MNGKGEHVPLEVDEIVSILNRISIFAALSDAQLRTVFEYLDEVRISQGDFVFESGDAPSHIYIVLEGKVEILLGKNGHFLALQVFEAGQCFGETSVIGIEPHTANAMALVDTKLIVLPRSALNQLWKSDKEIFGLLILNIAREACRRLSKTDEVLLHYFAEKEPVT